MFEIWTDASGELIYTDQGYYSPRVGLYDSDTLYHESRARDPKLTLEVNKAGSLSFTINQNDQSLVLNRGDVVYVKRTTDDKIIWAGRILSEERDSNNDRVIECEGALAYLNDVIHPSTKPLHTIISGYTDGFTKLINYYNSKKNSISSLRFSIGNLTKIDGSTIDPDDWVAQASYAVASAAYSLIFYMARESTISNIQRNYLDFFGGQISVHYQEAYSNNSSFIDNIIDYIDAFDTENRTSSLQTIEFGKNLVSITRKASVDDFGTVYIPYGRSLTELEKTWPYITGKASDSTGYENPSFYWLISSDPNSKTEKSYRLGYRIDSETGKVLDATAASAVRTDYGALYEPFVVTQDIEVVPGEKFYLTTYIEGPEELADNQYVGALAYAVIEVIDGNETMVASGKQAKNSKHTENNQTLVEVAEVRLTDEAITIPENSDDYINSSSTNKHYYLRVGRRIRRNDHSFELKKYNQYYDEDNLSIIDCEVTSSGDEIGKYYKYDFGADVYPVVTSTLTNIETYDEARRMENKALVNAFGKIEKVVSYDNSSTSSELYDNAKKDLLKESEKVEIEIQAVDLSFIDSTLPPFELLDLVHVISEPHAIDVLLPITKIELPLSEPERAVYTLTNDVSAKGKGPVYISQYMAETYKKV